MTTPVLAQDLDPLAERVRTLMKAGDWQAAILLIRDEADRLGLEHEDLGRQLAARAIELGHVKPLRIGPVQ